MYNAHQAVEDVVPGSGCTWTEGAGTLESGLFKNIETGACVDGV